LVCILLVHFGTTILLRMVFYSACCLADKLLVCAWDWPVSS
jgi:hypothetical protein